MKVIVYESDNNFSFRFTPETLEDALWMTRFELNAKKEVPYRFSAASKDGFSQYMSFLRKKEIRTAIG